MTTEQERAELVDRIRDYLAGGGLFNPELANHDEVRDLLIDCRGALIRASVAAPPREPTREMRKAGAKAVGAATSDREAIAACVYRAMYDASPVETEREAFEKWCRGREANFRAEDFVQRRDGNYSFAALQLAWEAWQAHASRPAAAVPRELAQELADASLAFMWTPTVAGVGTRFMDAHAAVYDFLRATSPKEPE